MLEDPQIPSETSETAEEVFIPLKVRHRLYFRAARALWRMADFIAACAHHFEGKVPIGKATVRQLTAEEIAAVRRCL